MDRRPVNQRTLGLIRLEPILPLQAREQQGSPAIQLIPNGRQAGVAKMDPHLMRAISQQLALQEGETGEPFPDLEDRHRTFAASADRRASGRSALGEARVWLRL